MQASELIRLAHSTRSLFRPLQRQMLQVYVAFYFLLHFVCYLSFLPFVVNKDFQDCRKHDSICLRLCGFKYAPPGR